MTEQSFLITPPPELVDKWVAMLEYCEDIDVFSDIARWGADQELGACVEWIAKQDWTWTSGQLRAARRPKPPSLKEQALAWCNDYIDPDGIIRRALEALPDD